MTQPQGPGSPYQLMYRLEEPGEPSLPESFLSIYPGDWQMPQPAGRPYIYTNFGMSRDGRISYNEPGMEAAYHVTKGDPHDRWLMALLRMRADAILVGDTTVRLEGAHFWSSGFIYPPDEAAFDAQRTAEGYEAPPMLVILSLNGNVDFSAECFTRPDMHVVLATTGRGAAANAETQIGATLDILDLGAESADLHRLAAVLYSDFGVKNLLCEGGSVVFANFLNQGLVDEEFVTWCPTFVGRSPDHFRPSYTEGVAWMPDRAPYSKPLTVHMGGDCIFLRTRVVYLD